MRAADSGQHHPAFGHPSKTFVLKNATSVADLTVPYIYRVHAIAPPIYRVYKIAMEVESDPAKDATNIAKHGVSLQAAERFDWDTALVVEDDRFDYGEVRFYAVGYIGDRLHTLIYADGSHEDAIRAISLWPSTRAEVKRYEA